MASEEARKKWGTIFMGDREASVEQLNAMQEHANRERLQKDRVEDYMERVKARAADRAREILGAAYAERQKVLEEAKGEAAVQKRLAMQECAKIKAEGEEIRKQAQAELEAAQAERDEAAKLREGAYEAGYQEGVDQAGAELHEFRAELGQSVATVLRGLERQRKNILANWREDLADLVKAAARAGTGLILAQEHEAILRQLVFQALEMLESRAAITVRVNPLDEESVSDLFRAARERVPELRQWTVIGDEAIERGGLVAESGTGSVDFKRANFREMVDGVLAHLGLPELERELAEDEEMASLVEQEVANIASLTPELEPAVETGADAAPEADQAQPGELAQGEADEAAPPPDGQINAENAPLEGDAQIGGESQTGDGSQEGDRSQAGGESQTGDGSQAGDRSQTGDESQTWEESPSEGAAAEPAHLTGDMAELEQELEPTAAADPSLAELEEELFPLEGQPEEPQAAQPAGPDPKTLAEGGFL